MIRTPEWPPELLSRSAHIADTARRSMTLAQLNVFAGFVYTVLMDSFINDGNQHSPTFDQRVTWGVLTMYHVCTHFIAPLTEDVFSPQSQCHSSCSFVELVAENPQDPLWFVSHFWGDPFALLVRMLNYQALAHKLGDHATYWVCTFGSLPLHWEFSELTLLLCSKQPARSG